VVGLLPGHVVSRQAIQLPINDGSQPLKRLMVAVFPSAEQRCYPDCGDSHDYPWGMEGGFSTAKSDATTRRPRFELEVDELKFGEQRNRCNGVP
jgi:hypothetical protein